VNLRPAVAADLSRHGIGAGPDDTPETLRERLNDRYLEDVRRLKALQVAGEIPLKEYAARVQALKESYPLLGLPARHWVE
jgi:hypothetical protein